MEPKKFEDKTKKVAGTTEVNIVSIDYLDPEYKIETLSNHLTTPTGLLEVAKLNPQKSDLPQFIFRWDENRDELDVDIYQNGELCNYLWSHSGYRGHHTKKKSPKIFEADIGMPNRDVFKGKIDVGLFIKIFIKNFGVGIDSATVIHKKVKIEDAGKGKDNILTNQF